MPQTIGDLWESADKASWSDALDSYWDRVSSENLELERRLDRIEREEIRSFDATGWLTFLDEAYFPWKYTQANRLASSRRWLHRQVADIGLDGLDQIRRRLLDFDPREIARPLHVARCVKGLGVAGASGLLSLLYPEYFCTVDQFLVRNLREVRPDIPELREMEPEQLTGLDGVILTEIVRAKASELSHELGDRWTPRDVDKVLWACRPARSDAR